MVAGWAEFRKNIAVNEETGCWIWTGRKDSKGYGFFRNTRAHIFTWTQENGPVPSGMQLDHFKCDNPPCANPAHVRPATPRENTLRGKTIAAENAAKNACPKCGGPYEVRASTGRRFCRPCGNAGRRKRRAPEHHDRLSRQTDS